MDTDQHQEMNRLCTLIQTEQNPDKFFALIEQLNDLLERKEERLIAKLRDSGRLRDSGSQAA
jgi:hypothetical protein